jgi:hypothetical protein
LFPFKCRIDIFTVTDNYVDLGLALNEFLDYNFTAKFVAKAARRALGLVNLSNLKVCLSMYSIV